MNSDDWSELFNDVIPIPYEQNGQYFFIFYFCYFCYFLFFIFIIHIWIVFDLLFCILAIIIQEDEINNYFYQILEGIVSVERANLQLSLLGQGFSFLVCVTFLLFSLTNTIGDCFGENCALFGREKATATIVAQKNVVCRRLVCPQSCFSLSLSLSLFPTVLVCVRHEMN
jgi:CRP-like cAMP-binding protein